MTIWPSVLELGTRLERERRWAEALSHYEDALRQHPQRPDLQQRVSCRPGALRSLPPL